MGHFDRFILLASLTIFFFGGALALIDFNLKQKKDMPRSVMISPTAAQMILQDPQPKADKIVKLCYSHEKFIEDVRMDGLNLHQKLIARGISANGEPIEIYASNMRGYGGVYAVYVWEKTPENEIQICRILHGKNLEFLNEEQLKDIAPGDIPVGEVEPEPVPLPTNAPDFLNEIGRSFELQSVPEPETIPSDDEAKTGSAPTEGSETETPPIEE